MWQFNVFPISLGIFDLILLIMITIFLFYMAYKTEENLRNVFLVLGVGLLIVLFFSPMLIDIKYIQQLSGLGIYAVVLIYGILLITPPYPDLEWTIILPLKMLANVPLWIGEIIAQVVGWSIVIGSLFFAPNMMSLVLKAIANSFTLTPLSWLIVVIWLGAFVALVKVVNDS